MSPWASPPAEYIDIVYGRNKSYGWTMQHADVANIHRDDIVAFYKRYYFPANIILSVQKTISPRPRNESENREALRFVELALQLPPVPPSSRKSTIRRNPAFMWLRRATSRRARSRSG